MYSRAVWLEDSQEMVGTVPSNWIANNELYWPNNLQVVRAHKNRENPNKSWKKFKVVKVKCTGDEDVCDQFGMTSAEETDSGSHAEKAAGHDKKTHKDKQRLPHPPEYNDFRKRSSYDMDSPVHEKSPKRSKKLRSPRSSDDMESPVRKKSPKTLEFLRRSPRNFHMSPLRRSPRKNIDTSPRESTLPLISRSPRWSSYDVNNRSSLRKRQHSSILDSSVESTSSPPKRFSGSTSIRSLYRESDKSNSSSKYPKNGAAYNNQPMSATEFQNKVLRMLSEIKTILVSLPDHLGHNTAQGGRKVITPCSDMQDVNDLEEKLKDHDFRTAVVDYLSRCGGKDEREITTNVMMSVMSNAVQGKFNVFGRDNNKTGRKKKAFSELILYEVVIESILAHKKSIKKQEINKLIGNLLKNAPARKNGKALDNEGGAEEE